MSFLNDFESKIEGVNDTVEFVIRVAIVTLAAVILVVVMALVVGLFVPNELVDSKAILETINPAFQTIIGAFVGLLGGLSLNANVRDKKELAESEVAPEPPVPTMGIVEEDDDDDDMADYEKYRHDLRWDKNGDGIVSDDEMPNWRNPAA
jgi:hypothetical protein